MEPINTHDIFVPCLSSTITDSATPYSYRELFLIERPLKKRALTDILFCKNRSLADILFGKSYENQVEKKRALMDIVPKKSVLSRTYIDLKACFSGHRTHKNRSLADILLERLIHKVNAIISSLNLTYPQGYYRKAPSYILMSALHFAYMSSKGVQTTTASLRSLVEVCG